MCVDAYITAFTDHLQGASQGQAETNLFQYRLLLLVRFDVVKGKL